MALHMTPRGTTRSQLARLEPAVAVGLAAERYMELHVTHTRSQTVIARLATCRCHVGRAVGDRDTGAFHDITRHAARCSNHANATCFNRANATCVVATPRAGATRSIETREHGVVTKTHQMASAVSRTGQDLRWCRAEPRAGRARSRT